MANREPNGERVGSFDPGTVMNDDNGPRRPFLVERHEDRDRGGLTKKDRMFLVEGSDEETNEQTIRDRRYRIRKRITDSMKDFEIFSWCLEPRDRRQVFQSLYDEDRDYLKEVGVFLYLGFKDLGTGRRQYLKDVIESAERRKGRDVEVTVSSTTGNNVSYQITIDDVAPPTQPTDAD